MIITLGNCCEQCLCAKCDKRSTCISHKGDIDRFCRSECLGAAGYMRTCVGYDPDTSWITPELAELIKEAQSCPGIPPGNYIGEVRRSEKIFYYYKDGGKYYYENSYSREMREKAKERRRSNSGKRMVNKSRF